MTNKGRRKGKREGRVGREGESSSTGKCGKSAASGAKRTKKGGGEAIVANPREMRNAFFQQTMYFQNAVCL